MHRATALNVALRSFTAGGARSCVQSADDTKLMQEMGGNFMAGESRQRVESPQNYGFTSVVMDADMGSDGSISGSAETFISFIGGGRSTPVATVMDDRRHRLKNLQKGDVAMFRTKSDKQQFHLTQDGGFWSAPQDKTARMQLVANDQQQQQGQQGQAGQTGQQGGQSGKPTGQQSVYKGGQSSDFFFHLTQDGAMASGKNVYLRQGSSFGSSNGSSGSTPSQRAQTDNIKVHCSSDGNVYLGGQAGDSGMLRVLLEGEQISSNVYAKSGGGTEPPDTKADNGTPMLPVLMLLLGLSLGANYALITGAWSSAVQMASR